MLAAAYYLWTLASPRADARVGLRGAVMLYLVMAGVVWNLFVTERSMGYTPANTLLHVIVPVLALSAPYYFLDPDGVGPAAVIVNVGVLGGACSH